MKKIRILSLMLALLMLLTACGSADPEAEETISGWEPGEELGIGEAADDVFSLNYNSSASLNPYATNDLDNLLIGQLVYENIFELDDSYNLSSRVIAEYSNTGGTYWMFKIKEDIPMHDGSTLTAYDVAYSIQQAMRSSRYRGRFASVYGAGASSETDFAVSLAKPDMLFPYLLTIPIVKDGSVNESRPAGSGPYMHVADADYVQAFADYGADVPVERIYMKEYTDTESIITAFEDGYIDLVLNDTSSATNLGYGGNTETRWYTTTNMHYFGFNMSSELAAMPGVRYAIGLAVDRQYAAETLMQGDALPSALPVSPTSPYYDESIASPIEFNLQLCAQVLANAGLSDRDADGMLEYLSYSVLHDVELDVIVCSQSAGKGDVCNRLAEDLESVGVKLNVIELSWADYVSALNGTDLDADGEPDVHFDMYYAEVKLGADFDLTSLFSGSMNYGGIEDENYASYINAFLAAGDLERPAALSNMLTYIAQNAPIIPVCFERHEVITRRNVITGIEVTSSNVFYNITEWKIRLTAD